MTTNRRSPVNLSPTLAHNGLSAGASANGSSQILRLGQVRAEAESSGAGATLTYDAALGAFVVPI